MLNTHKLMIESCYMVKRVRRIAVPLLLVAAVVGLVGLCVWDARTPPRSPPAVVGTVLLVEPRAESYWFQVRPTGDDRPHRVIVEQRTRVRRADGSAGTIAPGQIVRVWSNRMKPVDPPIWFADWVLIESDGP